MKKHEIQDERLDAIGRKLLETSSIREDELERIVSAPHLFSAIKARVRTEQVKTTSSSFDRRALLSFLVRPNSAAAFAALLIAVLAFGGFYFYARQKAQPADALISKKEATARPALAEPKPVAALTSSESAQAADGVKEEGPIKPSTALYHPATKPSQSLRANFRKNSAAREIYESDGEFYPLTFTGSSNEIAPGAQIVRVELPRSSLFSMGVDLPGDDRSGMVKADLLISADGVTRGFRLVK